MAAPGFESSTQAAIDSSLTLSIDKPANSTGKPILAVVNANNDVTVWNTPAGWVLVDAVNTTGTGGGSSSAVFMRTAGAEAGPYEFTIQGANARNLEGGISCYNGAAVSALGNHSGTNDGNASSTTIPTPDVLADQANAMIVRIWTAGNTTITPDNATLQGRVRVSVAATTNPRNVVLADLPQGSSGQTGNETATSDSATGHMGYTVVIYGVPDTTTQRPEAGGSTTNLSTYDHTRIDEPTDTDDGEWLTGTDPSGTSTSHAQQFADGRALWTGSTAHTWTNEANARDTSDATFASYALGANNTDYIDHWSFSAAKFTGIPSNATITGIQALVRMRAGTNNRLTAWIQLATANGSVLGNEYQVDGGTAIPTTVGDFGANAVWSTLPTRAQLVSGTFGVRTRIRRSNTVTCEMYSIKVTVTYTLPGSTVPITVVAVMSDPVAPDGLKTGAGTGIINARLRPLGNGAGTPNATVAVENAAGSVLATPINNQPVSANAVLSGSFDQSVVGAGTDVRLRVTSAGVEGKLVEVGSLEWVGQKNVVAGLTPLRINTDMRWAVRAALQQASDLRWAVRTLLQQTTELRWGVRTPLGMTSTFQWRVAQAIRQDADLQWAVKAPLQQTTDLRWAVKQLLLHQSELRWAARQSLLLSTDLRWMVDGAPAPVIVLTDIQWAAKAAYVHSTDIRWSARVPLQHTTELRWAAKAPMRQDTNIQWRVAQLVQHLTDIQWAIRQRVLHQTDLQWGIRVPIQQTTDLRWAIRSPVQQSTDLRWAIRQSLQVASELRWAIRQGLAVQTDLRWAVRSILAALTELRWEVESEQLSVLVLTDLRWPVRAPYKDTTDLRWGIRVPFRQNTELDWAIRTFLEIENDLRWATKQAVRSDSDLRWGVRVPFRQTTDLRWEERLAFQLLTELDWGVEMLPPVELRIDTELRWQVREALLYLTDLRWGVQSEKIPDWIRDGNITEVTTEQRISQIVTELRMAQIERELRVTEQGG